VLARADAGRIPIESAPVRLDVLAEEIVETMRSASPAGGVEVAVESSSPVLVLGDERWLRQLVFNLVDNAVKFAGAKPGDGKRAVVRLSVWLAGGRGLLSVSDNGPGIPVDKIGHVFERFYRADSARTLGDQEGSGLGLSIAAWIASAHQGEIRVENRGEGGCRFIVGLPLAAASIGRDKQ
jgi:signal transduction histidine kinase